MTSETPLLQRTLLIIGALRHARYWRNNSGKAWVGKAVRLKPGQVIRAGAGDVLVRGARMIQMAPTGAPDVYGVRSFIV